MKHTLKLITYSDSLKVFIHTRKLKQHHVSYKITMNYIQLDINKNKKNTGLTNSLELHTTLLIEKYVKEEREEEIRDFLEFNEFICNMYDSI